MDTRWIDRRAAERQAALGVGLFNLLRELERGAGGKPRIGQNTRLRDALVRLGQDPFLAFPDTDLSRLDRSASPPKVRAQFLGFFGAFGAFPLNWTEEIRQWYEAGDDSFVAFADIFAARFQELFFRAWSDSRAITQFDHPTGDRFQSYVQAQLGMATAAFQNRDSVADTFKLRLAPLAAGRIKSAVRLRQMLALHLESAVFVAIEEMVPMWLDFEPDALCRVGVQASILGRNIHLGARVRAISEKFRIHLHVQDIDTYRRFLPGGPDHAQLRDIVFWYLGQRHAIEIALWLPQPQVQPAVLGETAVLGWMACIAPDASQARQMVDATRYTLTPHTLPQDIQRSA
jgi:type VI secretion system protein ImpH